MYTYTPEPPVLVPAGIFNGAGGNLRQETVAAEGAVLPLIYGRQRVGAKIAGACVYNHTLHLIAVWCDGPVTAVEAVTVDDATPDAAISVTTYLGTAAQTANADLVAAYAANGIVYADAMAYTCYSVVKVPYGVSAGFPRLAATIKGLELYDPRGPATEWSANPALMLADYITNARYGMGREVAWDSVELAADACDEVVGGAPRRAAHLVIDRPMEVQKWLDVLRGYAACWLAGEGAPYRLIPDRPAASVLTFDAGAIVKDSMRLAKRGVMNAPTVVTVSYTDPTAMPWRAQTARAYAAGVLDGTTPWRESRVALPGILAHAQAYREAVERLNALTLNDLSAKWVVFDEGIKAQVGDVVTVTHPIGLTSKLMRVTGVRDQGFGRYELAAQEYDPAIYSDAVVSGPTYVDTTLGNPLVPPTVAGLMLSEDVYYISSGYYASRIRASWTAANWPHLVGYRCEVWDGATLVQSDTVQSEEYTTPPVAEGRTYTLRVSAFSTLAVGAPTSENITASGKNTAPGNVASVTATALGNMLLLSWTAAADLDLTAHEIRYWPVGGTWATGTVLDRVATPALRYASQAVPPGTWVIGVKGLDSVRNSTYPYGQPSTTEATATVTITVDPANLLVAEHDFTTPTLTNMVARTVAGATFWVTDFGATWDSLFTGTMSTYTLPVAAYHAAGAASLLTETYDFGQALAGTFAGSMDYTVLNGTATLYLELSLDNSYWVQYPGCAANATGRYARLRLEHTGTTDAVRVDGLGRVGLNVLTRNEVINTTSNASGATTVELAGHYSKYKQVVISPLSTAARSWTVDKVETSGARGVGAGRLLRSDGATGYVSVPDATQLHLSTLTWECWVQVAVDTTLPAVILGKGHTTAGSDTSLFLVVSTTGKLRWRCLVAGTYLCSVDTTYNINDGVLHHVAAVLDGGTTMTLYVDGVLVGSGTLSGSFTQPLGSFGMAAWPPAQPASSWSAFLKGRVDDVRVWNLARSQAQVQADMDTELAGSESGLVAYYKLNSTSGTTATDSTSNANHGTVNGTCWWRPYDGYDFYVFNSAGTQVAQNCDCRFEGV